MKKSTIKLGDLAKDTITGYKGVVIACTEWINGCVRLTLQAQEMKDGKPVDSCTFDVEQIALVKAGVAGVKDPSGGPCPDPGSPPGGREGGPAPLKLLAPGGGGRRRRRCRSSAARGSAIHGCSTATAARPGPAPPLPVPPPARR